MRFEIRKHWNKLKKVSKLAEHELQTAYDKVLTKIYFINEEIIPQSVWEKAETLVTGIDIDDTDFVALTRYLKGILWTGDKPLYEGLKSKQMRGVYNTQDMIRLRNRLSR
jgi:predicted nucleic acid-binding protein